MPRLSIRLVNILSPSNTVVDIDFFWVDCISIIIVDLKANVTDVHHWGSMCYVLCYICVLVTILDKEE